MKKMIVIFILSMLTSCFSSENWEIKKIKLANKEVYLKSHSWAIPERNSIILSNNNNKVFDSKIDIDFGSFVNVIFEIKDDSLRSEEHTSELQSRPHLVCRLLLEKKKNKKKIKNKYI